MNNYLKFEVIWSDEDIIEVQISANNGRYSGIIKVYDSSNSLLEFIDELTIFPFEKDKVAYVCGEKDSYAYFEMEYYKIGLTGKCGVLISMEEEISQNNNKERKKSKLTMELIVEPNAIDNFCRQIKYLAETEKGTAKLKAITIY